MTVRFGFSAVPKWRSKGVLGVALAAALLGETFVAAGSAVAAPPVTQPAAETPTDVEGDLQAPDIASARTIARLKGERVEVVGERTESSTTYALPDGSLSTGQAPAPIWMRTGDGDGTTAADWAAVDPTMELGDDGEVRPKGHPADLVLAGEGVPEDGLLLSMKGGDGQSVGLEWNKPLPKPRLEGPRAIYPEVQPGVDLVVEATRTGYEQFFVLTKKPGRGSAPDLSLRVRGEGLQAQATADGGVQFLDASGAMMGSSSTPLVWDAAVDAERLHPVGKKWERGVEAETALAPQPGWGVPAEDGPPAEPAVPQVRDGRAMPEIPATPPLPPQAGQRETDRPGRAASEEAAPGKGEHGPSTRPGRSAGTALLAGRRRRPRSTTTTRIRTPRPGSLRTPRCPTRSPATSTVSTATWRWRPARPVPECCS